MIVRKRRSAAGFACLALATVGAIALVLGLLHPAPIVRAQGPQVQVGKPGIPQVAYASGAVVGAASISSGNNIIAAPISLAVPVCFGNITVVIGTADASGSDWYAWGFYSTSGNALATTLAVNASTGGSGKALNGVVSQGTVCLGAGTYFFAYSGSASTATLDASGGITPYSTAIMSNTSSLTGSTTTLPASLTFPSAGPAETSVAGPALYLH